MSNIDSLKYVFVAICLDKPGILHKIAEFIADKGGQITKSYVSVENNKAIVVISILATKIQKQNMMNGIAKFKEENRTVSIDVNAKKPDNQDMMNAVDDFIEKKEETGIELIDVETEELRKKLPEKCVYFEINTWDKVGLLEEYTDLFIEYEFSIIDHNGRRCEKMDQTEYEYNMKFILIPERKESRFKELKPRLMSSCISKSNPVICEEIDLKDIPIYL